MSVHKVLARQALRGALDLRQRLNIPKDEPICIYDFTEKLGVEVKFCGGNSFGGMYAKGSQTILIPSLRPTGRQAFTCAHELGHWYFDHGTRVDELNLSDGMAEIDEEEILANLFAGFLLMPAWAVEAAFSVRGWTITTCSPLQVFTIANQLGVGYETLISHLRWSLKSISATHADRLTQTTPKKIKTGILGKDYSGNMIIADHAWTKVPLDMQTGELAIVPRGATIDGISAQVVNESKLGTIVQAIEPGISRAHNGDYSWATFIRVSRKNFEGRSLYRHLEDPDVDSDSNDNM